MKGWKWTVILAVALVGGALVLAQATTVRHAPGTRTVRDMAGREVQLPAEVHRAVSSLYPIATQLTYLVGARDRLVAISDYDVSPVMRSIWPEIETIPCPSRTGGQVPLEEVIRLKPDVVFTHMHSRTDQRLEELGISVVRLKLETPEQLMQGIELCGEIYGCEERASEVVAYYRDKLAAIRERTAGVDEPARVYFAGPDMLTTAGGDFFQHFLITSAGGCNVASAARGGWSTISLEQLLVWDPQCIFIGRYGTATVDGFLDDPRLRHVRAVQDRQVYMSRSFIGSWDVPTPESLLGVMWLANTLYPEAVHFDMAREMTGFYETCYGYTPTADEIRRVLEDR